MTVEPQQGQQPSQALVDYNQLPATGLEDFQVTDAVIPRLTIEHTKGTFKDNLSGQEYAQVNVIILGLVKQRVLWHTTVDDGDTPMCKSPDFITGFPDLETTGDKAFPWDKSGFDPSTLTRDPDGLVSLPCAGCSLKEWGSAPDGKKPYCSEQWTMPILYEGLNEEGHGSGLYVPALFSLHRSGLKPIKAYLTSFSNTGSPAFIKITRIALKLQSRGTVTYATPKFAPVGDTDPSTWAGYSGNFLEMRDYLTRRPVTDDDDNTAPSDNTNTPAQPQQQVAPQTPVPQAAAAPTVSPPAVQQPVSQQASAAPPAQPAQPVAQGTSVPDPWAAQTGQAAPGSDPWATPAAAPPQEPPAQPVAPAEPQPQTAPPQQAPAAQQQQAAPAVPPAQPEGGDDLPF